ANDVGDKAFSWEKRQQHPKKMKTGKVCMDIHEDMNKDECRDTKVNSVKNSIWAQGPRST
ncbi:3213_t:CDS:1, partial [Gigaspora rosea]